MPPQCPDLSILIPAFNEENRLGDSLERILDFVEIKGIHHETLVIDDGSSDRTYQVAESFKDRGTRTLRLDINQGKGAALRLGVLESRGRSVLLTDADLSTPIEDLDTLKPFLERSPIVFGSRAVHDSRAGKEPPGGSIPDGGAEGWHEVSVSLGIEPADRTGISTSIHVFEFANHLDGGRGRLASDRRCGMEHPRQVEC